MPAKCEQDHIQTLRNEISEMSAQQMLDWLVDPVNSTRPDIYADYLPRGIRFYSQPTAESCVDFVSKFTGLNERDVRPTSRRLIPDKNGSIIFFNIFPEGFFHTGVLYEGAVLSQWNQGAVFLHGKKMVPAIWKTGNSEIYRIR